MKWLIAKHLAKNIVITAMVAITVAGACLVGEYFFGSYSVGLGSLIAFWFMWLTVDMSISQARREKDEQDRIERSVIERLRNSMDPH